jgi:hypothetical protein
MCQFLSAIAFADGDVYTNDATDSHERLIAALDLDDSGDIEKNKWCRLEYTTEDSKDLVDITKYRLMIDQEQPAWITDELKDKWERKLRQRVKGMILTTGKKKILLGGKWILGGDVKIDCAVNTNIRVMQESSQVRVMREGSQVGVMWGSSQVGVMWEGSQVRVMRESSQVRVMRESSQVGEMRESSQVREMWES